MTKLQLYEFVTSLLGEIQIDQTLFDTFLDVSQSEIESKRPWVYLRSYDTTQTATPSDTFTTQKSLATDFKEWYEEAPIQLIDSNNSPIYLNEVPFSERYKYQKMAYRFCVDYANGKFYLLGNITNNFTIVQNYIKISTPVSTSDDSTWIFPQNLNFDKILGLMVAIKWRKGIDYDVFNQTLADNQELQVQAIYDTMSRWDSRLQYNMQRGKDPFNTWGIGPGSTNGGQINI